MTVSFVKMHGLGNDFVIVDGRETPIEPTGELVRTLANRRMGVGCDQLILLGKATSGGDGTIRIWNKDGGEVEACGNASRCVARLLMEETGKTEVLIETVAGPLKCTPAPGNQVTVDMGQPRLDWQDIPLAEEMDTRRLTIGTIFGREGGNPQPSAVNTGNPHCVFFVDNVGNVDLERIGPAVERHALFPERTNVEFAQVIAPNEVRLRVWERGTGITQACGTGACATAVAAVRKGLTGRKVQVHLDGGPLSIEWREEDDHILMTGDAALSFKGELADELLKTAGK